MHGVLCSFALCRILLRPVVLCRCVSCAVLCIAVLAHLGRALVLSPVAPAALGGVLWCFLWCLFVRGRASKCVGVSWRRVAALVSLAGLIGTLLFLVVCRGALPPCVLSCGTMPHCGAVLSWPAVFSSLLFLFFCPGVLFKPL